ncbi:MAG: PIN domain nuclease, partial [Actinomycetota bacterium]|nr:PIN domain nuclease [Actinomycetota bacterium]
MSAGTSGTHERQLRRLLLGFHQPPFDAVTDCAGATHISRRCRRAGITPLGVVGCMIAAVALRNGA